MMSHKESVSSAAVVGGGSSARVLDLTGAEIGVQAESVELPIGQAVFKVAWSPDGSLLTVSTTVSFCTAALT